MSESLPFIEGDDLERKVEERTAELRRLNQELRAELAERARTEEALRLKLAYFSEAQRLSQTGSWVFDTIRGVSTYWSAEQYRIYGFTPEEGPPSAEMDRAHRPPEEWARLMETVGKAVRDKADFDTDSWLEFPDGSTKYLRIIGYPVVDASGDVVELVGITIDVTKHKLAEDMNRRLAWIVESANDAVFSRTLEGIITSWNKGAEQIFGFRAEEMIGRHISTIIPDDRTDEVRDIIDSARRGEARRLETVRLRKDGRRIDVALTISAIKDTQDRLIGASVIARDMTERKSIEEQQLRVTRHAILRAEVSAAFNESESSLSAVLQICAESEVRHLDVASARIWTLDVDNNILELQASAGHYQHIECEPPAFPIGQNRIGQIAAQRKLISINSLPECEPFDTGKAEGEGLISFAGFPLIINDKVVGVAGIYSLHTLPKDVLEAFESISAVIAQGIVRKRAENSLREKQQLLHAIVDNSPALIHVQDMNHRALVANRSFAELLHLPPDQMLGKTEYELWQLSPVTDGEPELEIDTYRAFDDETLEAGEAMQKELSIPLVGGRRYFLTTKSVLHDAHGNPHSICTIATEITGIKRAAEELRRLQTELAHVSRVLTMGALTSSIAHEVNQPLAGVITNGNACLRWLAVEPPNLDEARDALNRIIRDGNRAGDVIKRTRALLKKRPPRKTPLDINEVVRETIALAHHEIQKSQILLRTTFSPDLPRVSGDKIQLQQVLLNLLMNGIDAIKASAHADAQLSVQTRRQEADKIYIAVKDSGIGLGQGELDKIFDAFHTTKKEGMGMGLSVSRSIIEAHGGRLWATPDDIRGATFHFTLPIGDEE